MGKLGKLGTDCVDLLNKLEKKWDDERRFGDQWILCDQLTMAVLIRPAVAKKSTTFKVLFYHQNLVILRMKFTTSDIPTGLYC